MSPLLGLLSPGHFVELFIRDEDTCSAGNEYNGEYYGARISAVFVVLVASALGSFFPVLSSRYSSIRMPPVCFFVAKFFGSGVIIATAFIHLLQPANANLSNECLGYPFDVYPLAFGIALIVLMLMFFLELIAYRWVEAKISNQQLDLNEPHTHSHFGDTNLYLNNDCEDDNSSHHRDNETDIQLIHYSADASHNHAHHLHTHNHNHSHNQEDIVYEEQPEEHHIDNQHNEANDTISLEEGISDNKNDVSFFDVEKQSIESDSIATYAAQILNVFVLEFGIIFHSIFVGLTLSCSGNEFISLYIVVVFHQMFEGLGLGTRIACVNWPRTKRWTPWLLCAGYTISTPIAIAIGIGVRDSYPPGSRRALITNGVFDSISAGILIYTGLIELMAHEFLFSDEFKGPGGFKKMIWAYIVMCVGAGLMALLGRWT